jgi:hypothetical protein
MTGHPTLRTVAVAASAALAIAAIAAPAAAAKKPKCMGHRATIVGTDKADVLKGTAKRDVIVAKGGADIIVGRGGNDIICAGPGNDRVAGQAGHDRIAGQAGADRLFGGGGVDRLMGNAGTDFLAGQAGPDILAGGVGNDRLDGGIGVDTCHQGSGAGPEVRCERPKPVIPVTPVVPPPPAKTLVIAYSDLDDSDTFNAGDVMIAKIVDTNGDTMPSRDDTIKMGSYPIAAHPTSPVQFLPWGVESHLIEAVSLETGGLAVGTKSGGLHQWFREIPGAYHDGYSEHKLVAGTGRVSSVVDFVAGTTDWAIYDDRSPSSPSQSLNVPSTGNGDDRLIEVEFLYGGSIL